MTEGRAEVWWTGLNNSGLRRKAKNALVVVVCPAASQHGRILLVVTPDGAAWVEPGRIPGAAEPDQVVHLPCTCGVPADSTHPVRQSRVLAVQAEAQKSGRRQRVPVTDVQ